MGELRTWALSLCAAAIASALCEMLLPKNAQKKTMLLVLNLFVLVSLVTPLRSFGGWEPELSLPMAVDREAPAQQLEQQLLQQQLDEKMGALVREKLEPQGIIVRDVRIDIIVSGQELSIGEVTVVLGEDDDMVAGKAKNQLERELGLPVRVQKQGEVR